MVDIHTGALKDQMRMSGTAREMRRALDGDRILLSTNQDAITRPFPTIPRVIIGKEMSRVMICGGIPVNWSERAEVKEDKFALVGCSLELKSILVKQSSCWSSQVYCKNTSSPKDGIMLKSWYSALV
jgi:hypothetical protein